jgi:hypothetical protein
MRKLFVLAVIGAACSSVAFAAEVKKDKAHIPAVKATTMSDADMDKVTTGGGGQNVADANHDSGVAGASGNPNASAGPGFFIEPHGGPQAVSQTVHFVQGK